MHERATLSRKVALPVGSFAVPTVRLFVPDFELIVSGGVNAWHRWCVPHRRDAFLARINQSSVHLLPSIALKLPSGPLWHRYFELMSPNVGTLRRLRAEQDEKRERQKRRKEGERERERACSTSASNAGTRAVRGSGASVPGTPTLAGRTLRRASSNPKSGGGGPRFKVGTHTHTHPVITYFGTPQKLWFLNGRVRSFKPSPVRQSCYSPSNFPFKKKNKLIKYKSIVVI